MQSKSEAEEWYQKNDPFNYIGNNDDAYRKKRILSNLKTYNRGLDIGCGEGFITKDLPCKTIYGYDLSEIVMSRLPSIVSPMRKIEGKFDLIVATGILYNQYDYKWVLDIIRKHAIGTVITCNIKAWEINDLPNQIYEEEFKYREYEQKLRVYDFTSFNRK